MHPQNITARGLVMNYGLLPNRGLLYGFGRYGFLFAWNVAQGVSGGTFSRTGDATYVGVQGPFFVWDVSMGVTGGTFARTGEATYNQNA